MNSACGRVSITTPRGMEDANSGLSAGVRNDARRRARLVHGTQPEEVDAAGTTP
jgi:hypothetical protein